MERYDVVISGGGPCGSFLGYNLASLGFKVCILEKSNFPRYKVCAGGLPKKILKLIDFDISQVIEDYIKEIEFSYNFCDKKKILAKDFLAFTVKRENFDYFLLKKAEEKGAKVFLKEGVLNFKIEDEGVVIESVNKRVFRCKVLVGCDGVFSTIRRLADIKTKSFILTLEKEIEVQRLDNFKQKILINFDNRVRGYFWIFPKKDILSCGVGGAGLDAQKAESFLKEWLSKNLLTDFKVRFSYFWPIYINVFNPPLILNKRVILAGEAAGLVNPLSGEGIYWALKSSKLASICISEFLNRKKDLKNYSKIIKKYILSKFKKHAFLSFLLYNTSKFGYNLFIKYNKKIKKWFTEDE